MTPEIKRGESKTLEFKSSLRWRLKEDQQDDGVLRWKSMEGAPEGDFFVRSGPGTVKLPPDGAQEYIRTRLAVRGGRER